MAENLPNASSPLKNERLVFVITGCVLFIRLSVSKNRPDNMLKDCIKDRLVVCMQVNLPNVNDKYKQATACEKDHYSILDRINSPDTIYWKSRILVLGMSDSVI